MDRVRVDKWLWAARFFKTRNLARQAIDAGKVQLDGARVKPSKEIRVGDTLTIRVGWEEKVVQVAELSEQRRGAAEANKLYAETPASLARREAEAERRRALRGAEPISNTRPNKKQRRQIHRFLQRDQGH